MRLIDFLLRLLGFETPPRYSRRPPTSPSSTEDRDLAGRPYEEESALAGGDTVGQSRPLTGLDVDKFVPLTVKEAFGETQTANWQTAYLDPTWEIPTADLPRIRVIDGTMVGLGLISSDELAGIHEIGREMDQFRNRAGHIDEMARQAVARSREERARIKEEKKRQAAERRRAHAEAVAHRRATDIFYLGRGVSKGLADRRANLEKLEANRLPVLSTPADVAAALGISIAKLRWLAFHSEAPTRSHYVYFKVPKKGGGERQLATPHRQLAAAQRWVLANILDKLPVHDAAHGFVRGRSTVTNADQHVGADIVINTDLCDFFPSITFYRAEGLFRSFGYSPAAATILALICTECPRELLTCAGKAYFAAIGIRGLPQGACTSPAISNLISRNLDHRLSGIAARLGCRYSRYADDITFSAADDMQDFVGYLLARIRHISEDEGFRVNEKKTRVLRNHTRQSVTGVVVNDTRSVNREMIRRLRAILHNARRTGLAAQNRSNIPHFKSWLRGKIAYVEMVAPKRGRELREQFEVLR